MTVDVSIIIPSLGRTDQLRNFIGAILSQDFECRMEIIVVMDGSDCEDAAKALEGEFGNRQNLLFDVSRTRRGSAAAKNVGARIASGELLIFLDDDTIPSRSWLRFLIGSYSAEIVGVGGSERKRDRPSLLTRLLHSLYGGRTGRITKSGVVISNYSPDKRGSEFVDCLQGCNMSFRRDAFLRIGGFDENFIGTAYREETDLSIRIGATGKLLFTPKAMVDHLEEPHGGNTPSSCRDWNYWYHRNNTYFYMKNFEPVARTLWMRHWMIELMLAAARMLVQRDLFPVIAMRSGIMDGRKALMESRG